MKLPYLRQNKVYFGVAIVHVLYPGREVCADPVNGGAILGKGGPSPHSRDRERQLTPDKGRGKT
jgi:hypothetical protein